MIYLRVLIKPQFLMRLQFIISIVTKYFLLFAVIHHWIFQSKGLVICILSKSDKVTFNCNSTSTFFAKFDLLQIKTNNEKVGNRKKTYFLKILKSLSIFINVTQSDLSLLLTWPWHVMLEIDFYLYCIFHVVRFFGFYYDTDLWENQYFIFANLVLWVVRKGIHLLIIV